MTYEQLLEMSDAIGLITREKHLHAYDGRIKGNRVAIRRSIPTVRQKACVLAEELGHYFTSSGDILNDSVSAKKQELRARKWAYDTQIGLDGLIRADAAGCKNIYETAEYLEVPEGFLIDCLNCYQQKYGSSVRYRGYMVKFDPAVNVLSPEEVRKYSNDW